MLLKLSLNSRIPVILDIVVTPAGKILADIGPSIAMMLVHSDKYCFFIVSPFALLEIRVEMVDESLTALLSLTPR